MNRLRKVLDSFLSRFTTNSPETEKFRSSNLVGIEYTELVEFWIKQNFPTGFKIVLLDISPSAKPSSFWSAIPSSIASEMIKDVVILHAKDLSDMNRALENIPRNFAKAICFYNGRRIDDNFEDY